MTEESSSVGVVSGYCGTCEEPFTDPAAAAAEPPGAPCPNCDATEGRVFEVEAAEFSAMHEYVKAKGKRPGEKKPYLETEEGQQLRVSKGDYVDKFRRIDRDNDQYDELVVDRTTGEIINESHEPLSDHKFHGSAKPKPGS